MKIRMLVADDHALIRDGLKALVGKEMDLEIVGEALTGREAVDLARTTGAHVVLMEVSMPVLNGIEATRRIVAANPQVKVIAMSLSATKESVREMFTAGAAAYVPVFQPYEELVRAIRTVMTGRKYLSPEVTGGVVDDYVTLSSANGGNPAFVTLTEREREVLQQLAEGRSTKEMAVDLDISVKTIETHRRNIMKKIDIHSVAELTKYAVREGVSSLDA